LSGASSILSTLNKHLEVCISNLIFAHNHVLLVHRDDANDCENSIARVLIIPITSGKVFDLDALMSQVTSFQHLQELPPDESVSQFRQYLDGVSNIGGIDSNLNHFVRVIRDNATHQFDQCGKSGLKKEDWSRRWTFLRVMNGSGAGKTRLLRECRRLFLTRNVDGDGAYMPMVMDVSFFNGAGLQDWECDTKIEATYARRMLARFLKMSFSDLMDENEKDAKFRHITIKAVLESFRHRYFSIHGTTHRVHLLIVCDEFSDLHTRLTNRLGVHQATMNSRHRCTPFATWWLLTTSSKMRINDLPSPHSLLAPLLSRTRSSRTPSVKTPTLICPFSITSASPLLSILFSIRISHTKSSISR